MSDSYRGEQKAARELDGVTAQPRDGLVPMGPGKPPAPSAGGRSGPALVSHVAEHATLYAGETLIFFSRVEVRAPVEGFSLRVRVPAGLAIETYVDVTSERLPVFETVASDPYALMEPDSQYLPVLAEPVRYVVWSVDEPQAPGACYDYEIRIRVHPALAGATLSSQATLYIDDNRVDQETAQIQVRQRARYLSYLPALYEQDEYMGRFLMLFESFWRPIESQIDQLHYYLDPQLTPARFLPWLASWFNLSVQSEEWTEEKQRRLLSSLIWLYRKRGTKHALQEYLEILTEHPVEITEHRAKDFRLGPSARLGVGVALGTGNVPHTFGVHLQLDAYRKPAGMDESAWEPERKRREEDRRRLIEQLLEMEKPAHTQFTVEYEIMPPHDTHADEQPEEPVVA